MQMKKKRKKKKNMTGNMIAMLNPDPAKYSGFGSETSE